MEETVKESFRETILTVFGNPDVDIRTYSPLSLAFLGDAVYSMIIRTIVISKGNRQAEKLHNDTKRYVSAPGQAAIADAIEELLTEEEFRIYKRGKNASPYHHAKNASLEDYLKATGLEALCGYLYLQDQTDRFLELLDAGIKKTETEKQ